MNDCVFCRIVAGTEPSSPVYDDEATMAFMNLKQANPGHVLVIPKAHVATVYDLDAGIAGRLLQTVVVVARAVRTSMKLDGLNILQFNGEAAGQDIFHVHFHVFPRRWRDGLVQVYQEVPPDETRSELDRLAEQISAAIGHGEA